MLQLLPFQQDLMPLAILGKHHLPDGTPHISFREFTKLCKNPLADGSPRIFHARRNDELIQALIAKTLFGSTIKIVFTSTAQRHHSKFTCWLMGKMDAIITTSSAAGSYLKRPADTMIPHGIDIGTFKLKEKTTPSKTIKLGVFGRVRPSKGIDLLIDAVIPVLKAHPQITLSVCGETTLKFQPYLNEQKHKLKQAGVAEQVEFLGKVSFNELPGLYRSMDIVFAVSRNEGFGLTPLEAMASGAAVLTSEAGAWKDIVENGIHGYCVPTNDSKAIREKLQEMICDPAKLITMGLAGRKHVEQYYTNQREAEQLCQFFKNLQKS